MNHHPSELPGFIYKITTGDLWDKAQRDGVLQGMPIDINDGYMHFSTAAQLRETLRLHFRGQSQIFVLQVPLAPIAANITWEPSRGGALFPHLYDAPLKIENISQSWPVSVDAHGQTNLPEIA